MNGEDCVQRPLFGGATSSCFPLRFQDVSNIREVPDHQEVFADPHRDESLIFELLDLKHEVGDNGSAVWFLRDIASEQDAEETMILEHSGTLEAVGLICPNGPAIATTAVGQMAIAKGRQGREAQNLVRVYLANLRLKEVSTDVVITAYEPIIINESNSLPVQMKAVTLDGMFRESISSSPLSESARIVGAGPVVPAAQAGCLPVAEVFKLAVTNFKVHDWNLFSSGA